MKVYEGSEINDLARLVTPVLGIDQYKSKMGDDQDIIVVDFTVLYAEPAADLMNFIEKSYEWVLDADVSQGELEHGKFSVFVEIPREPASIKNLYSMLEDVLNLTGQRMAEWKFSYYNSPKKHEVTLRNLLTTVIATPEEYSEMLKEKETTNAVEESQLNSLKASAGVTVQPKKLTDPQLVNIQIMAGIK